jgi:NitT/TauT family transport system permease protein
MATLTSPPQAEAGRRTLRRPAGGSVLRKLGRAFLPKGRIGQRSALILAVTAFALIFAAWAWATYGGHTDPMFLPSPTTTADSAVKLVGRGFLGDIWSTVYRVLAGFAIAAVVAVPLGVLIGTYAPVSAFLEGVFSFVRYMPASAFIPLFIFWIGIGESEKIAVIILGSFPQLVLMVATNVRNVPLDLIEVSYTLGTNQRNVLWRVILPKAVPDIVDTLRIVLGWAWTYVIVAEIVGASSGIGFRILQAQRTVQVGTIFVGILTLGIIGLIVDKTFMAVHDRAFAWSK